MLPNFENGADVGMAQSGGSTSFAAKTLQRCSVSREIVGQKFQGYEATEFDVFGFVDDSHSAAAEFLDNPVVRDGLTDHLVDCRGISKVQHILGTGRRQVNDAWALPQKTECRRIFSAGVSGFGFEMILLQNFRLIKY